MKGTFGPHRRLEILPLEDRTLPAAGVTASLRSGVLTVTGTEAADTIVVRQTDRAVTVDANGQKLNFAGVSQVSIDGRGGDDKLYMDTSAATKPLLATIHGGAGNDLIVGGGANDRLYGDGGTDTIYGDGGDDWIEGGTGADRVYGNAGNDVIFGNEGDDLVSGGVGDDYVDGGAGDDWVYGLEGNDTLIGGLGADVLDGSSGNDTLYGGAGEDWLAGGAGDDKLYAGDGDDRLDGGAGSDTLQGNAGYDVYRNDISDILDGKSEVQNVKQGEAGTCVLLSSLAAVTNKGIDLAGRIKQVGENQYNVPLYRPGTGWVTQSVYFDGQWSDNDPMLANPGDAWVLIYQRAYLQEMGVRWTDPNQDQWADKYGDKFQQADSALIALTGAAMWHGGALDKADLGDLRTAANAHRPAIALTNGSGAEKYGLISGHAYTVMAVSADGKVTLRNPWGTDGPLRQGADDGLVTVSWDAFRTTMQGFVTA
ncbi:MAG: hypothetical protein U0746_16220 [Gemmataceae bacterium]